MTKKSAIQKIEAHEKLCRIMQKQTFEQIKELKDKINRLEKILLGTAAFHYCFFNRKSNLILVMARTRIKPRRRREGKIKTSVKSGNFRPTKSGAGMTRKGVYGI
jgi:hypothetical protein